MMTVLILVNNMDQYHLNKVLSEKKITDYLAEKGIYPVRRSGNKYLYLCPIHKGDKDPSFMVYEVGTKGRNYQTYYCFACHSGINIINLVSDLEKRSIKNVLAEFFRDVKIDQLDRMDSIIQDIDYFGDLDEISDNMVANSHKVEFTLLKISLAFRQHLSYIDFDEEDRTYFEKPFHLIDQMARARDIGSLETAYNTLVVRVFPLRVREYQKREEEKILKRVQGSEWK